MSVQVVDPKVSTTTEIYEYLTHNPDVTRNLPEPGTEWIATEVGFPLGKINCARARGIIKKVRKQTPSLIWETKPPATEFKAYDDIPDVGEQWTIDDIDISKQHLPYMERSGMIERVGRVKRTSVWTTDSEVYNVITEMDERPEPFSCPDCFYEGFYNTGDGLECRICGEVNSKEDWEV